MAVVAQLRYHALVVRRGVEEKTNRIEGRSGHASGPGCSCSLQASECGGGASPSDNAMPKPIERRSRAIPAPISGSAHATTRTPRRAHPISHVTPPASRGFGLPPGGYIALSVARRRHQARRSKPCAATGGRCRRRSWWRCSDFRVLLLLWW
ncbi:hypothetical protein BDY21DRAFT_99394 [Lineolata rhizophorae]|uniref:Uncharacterized protein n=1 Tax=Lineolata rhizophorae TaxID=578093 RepID=A0A6A6NSX6_9PEZI|nr:hypothetical protein BDY21DRAFT_99394 [Lineolata rhizophorae]